MCLCLPHSTSRTSDRRNKGTFMSVSIVWLWTICQSLQLRPLKDLLLLICIFVYVIWQILGACERAWNSLQQNTEPCWQTACSITSFSLEWSIYWRVTLCKVTMSFEWGKYPGAVWNLWTTSGPPPPSTA